MMRTIGDAMPAANDHTVEQDVQAIEVAKTSQRLQCDERPPLQPAGYRMLHLVGRGAFGEVWRAESKVGVQVAIKFFHARCSEQWRFVLDETKKLAMLHGEPRVVRLIEVDADAIPPYFVTDYAEGGSLAQLLQRGPLPLPRALEIFRQVVEAMAYVHARGIRHCDIKPGNVLLDAAGRPRVADFGQAHLSIEPTASALGTFFYMAPEQAKTDRLIPDASWDVYGLGALFYAMITGLPPRFDEGCKQELEQTAQLTHRLERYRRFIESAPQPQEHRKVPGMDRSLGTVIDRCLTLDTRERYRDAGDLLEGLATRDRTRRLQPLLIFALLAPLLLAVAVGLFGWFALTGAVNAIETTAVEDFLRSERVTANMAAVLIEKQLEKSVHAVSKFSVSDRLRPAVMAYLENPSRDNEQKLDERLMRMGDFEKHFFALIFVLDAKGKLLSSFVNGDSNKAAQIDGNLRHLNFSYRQYFNREADRCEATGQQHRYRPNLREGKDVPYVGSPYMSAAVGRPLVIPISAPIYKTDRANPDEMIGVLVACLNLEEVHTWLDPIEEESGGCAVVLDHHGYCVHHRKALRGQLAPKPDEPSAQLKAPIYDKVLAHASGDEPNHVDPLDGRTYFASYRPIQQFNWGVIVQHDRDAVMEETRHLRERFALYVVAGGVLSGLILSAFWGWLLWLLRGREVRCDG